MEQEQTEDQPLRVVMVPFELSPSSHAKISLLRLWERMSEYTIILLGGGELTEAQEKHNKRVDLIHTKLRARIIKKYGVEEEYLAQYNRRKTRLQNEIAEREAEICGIDLDIQMIS